MRSPATTTQFILAVLICGCSPTVYAGAGDTRVDQGEMEIKFELARESRREKGFELGISYGLTPTFQIEFAGSDFRDRNEEPALKIRGLAFEAEWWPLELPGNIGFGLKLGTSRETARGSEDGKEVERSRETALLFSWENEPVTLDWEVGYETTKDSDGRQNAWGTSFTIGTELSERADIELEWSKQQRDRHAIEIAIGFELADDLDLIISIGRQSPDTFGAIGLEYSF